LAGHWTNQFSFVTGVVRRRDVAYLALFADAFARLKTDHTHVVGWHAGQWVGGNIGQRNWTTVGAALCRHPLEQGVFLGLWGEILCVGSGDVHDEQIIASDEDTPAQRGPMRGIRGIGGKAYAVGMARQVYRRDGANLWSCIDQGARLRDGEPVTKSFEAIDGFSEEEIYAVGRGGAIWRYDGRLWQPVDSPTNMILTNVCCAGDGRGYACGRVGMLVRGRGQTWEVIEHEDTEEDFWGLAWYNDTLYLSTMRFVYTLQGDHLQPVDFGDDAPGTCFHLSAADGVLWSIGAKDVMAFNGTTWARID
jgi:hypothetical protein